MRYVKQVLAQTTVYSDVEWQMVENEWGVFMARIVDEDGPLEEQLLPWNQVRLIRYGQDGDGLG